MKREPPWNFSLTCNHPSFSVHVCAKSEQAHFPNSCFFTRKAGSGWWEVVWDIFEQNTSNHFLVHVGSVKREALWNFSFRVCEAPEENQGMYSTRVTGCLPPSLVELHALEEPVLQVVASQVVEQIVALQLLLRWLRAPGSCT